MVLPSFTVVDKMPITVSGKIHRKALPEPEPENAANAEYVPAANGTEIALVDIFETTFPAYQAGE